MGIIVREINPKACSNTWRDHSCINVLRLLSDTKLSLRTALFFTACFLTLWHGLASLCLWTWSGLRIALNPLPRHGITLSSSMCVHVCVDVCGVKCVSTTCGSYLSRVTEMFLPRWLPAGCMWPRTVVPLSAKAKARIRDGGEAYHGPLLYLDWQTNSSFTQALFTKGSHPHLWESCL